VKIKDAIVERFERLCAQNNKKYTTLATDAGVTPSTVYSMRNPKRRDISVTTVKKLCDGLGISIAEFFDDDLFRDIPQEIE